MSKIKIKDKFLHLACLGTTKIGERGQIVIPAEVRRALKLNSGDKLFTFVTHGKVLTMIKTDAIDRFLSDISSKLLNSKRKANKL
ncbi:MAG: AbrB/MazE/SpoVT family DNA-binding domain-containing protein [Patescibacteria group bacterium]